MVRDLSCKSSNPPSEPEVWVDIWDGEWVRIPVTLCELWGNKDGPSDVTRTAKVKFPIEWDGVDITQFVNGFKSQRTVEVTPAELFSGSVGSNNPYDQARIWLYDHDLDTYQLAHYGYVGGVGPAAENGVMKLWVYDPADLMRGIDVSVAFSEPTIAEVLSFVLDGTDDNGNPVGLESRSVFDDIQTYASGIQTVPGEKGNGRLTAQYQLDSNYMADDFYNQTTDEGIVGGQQRFQRNKHNLVDVMDWLCAEVGAKWSFEPTADGPVLFLDNESEAGDYSRRMFVDDEIVGLEPTRRDNRQDISDFRDRAAFTTVDVLNNSALYDIKPFNTLFVYGESSNKQERQPSALDVHSTGTASAAATAGEQFPRVVLTYPPLVDRTGGYLYTAPTQEADTVYLDQTVEYAKQQFRQYIEEETEGHIWTKGDPYVLPWDYVRTIPVCDDTYQNVDITPITYEVNAVKHTIEAGDRYKTKLGVSLVFDESLLEVDAKYVEA